MRQERGRGEGQTGVPLRPSSAVTLFNFNESRPIGVQSGGGVSCGANASSAQTPELELKPAVLVVTYLWATPETPRHPSQSHSSPLTPLID